MSILTIIQDATKLLSLPVPTAVFNSTDNNVSLLSVLLQVEGYETAGRYEWPTLTREHTFTLVTDQASYALPTDFDFALHRTNWDRTSHWELYGPLTAQEWQWRQSGVIPSFPRSRYRTKGNTTTQFFIDSTPTSGDAGKIFVFEYQSKNWLQPVTWTASTVFIAGSYCFYNGNYYSTVSGGTTGSTAPTHTSGSVSDGGVTWAYYSGLYTRVTADTDIVALSESLFTLGIVWRFLKQKVMDWERAYQEYEITLQREANKLIGAPTLNMTKRVNPFFISPLSVPDSGYGS